MGNIYENYPSIFDSYIDYYFKKKLAYSFIKVSQEELLAFFIEEKKKLVLYFSSRRKEANKIKIEIFKGDDASKIYETNFGSSPYSSFKVNPFSLNKKKELFIFVVTDEKSNKYMNHFYKNIEGISYKKYLSNMKKWCLIKLRKLK